MSIDIEFAIKQDIRNNPVVRDIDPRQRRELRWTVGIAALIVGMLLFSAWQHYEVLSGGYDMERLRRDLAREESDNRNLRVELEMLRAPQVIERRAIDELHMVAPSVRQTIVIERAIAVAPSRAIVAAVR